jgi:Mn2+/Fe2+ NRAMP family transporter
MSGSARGGGTFLCSLAVNFLTLITEFAAISLALSALGFSPYVSVPISALGLTLMVVTGSYFGGSVSSSRFA